jgi:hypothetical protein
VGLQRYIQIGLAARGITDASWQLGYIAPTVAEDESKRDTMKKQLESLEYVLKKDQEFKTNLVDTATLKDMMKKVLLDAGYSSLIISERESDEIPEQWIQNGYFSKGGDMIEPLPENKDKIKGLILERWEIMKERDIEQKESADQRS